MACVMSLHMIVLFLFLLFGLLSHNLLFYVCIQLFYLFYMSFVLYRFLGSCLNFFFVIIARQKVCQKVVLIFIGIVFIFIAMICELFLKDCFFQCNW